MEWVFFLSVSFVFLRHSRRFCVGKGDLYSKMEKGELQLTQRRERWVSARQVWVRYQKSHVSRSGMNRIIVFAGNRGCNLKRLSEGEAAMGAGCCSVGNLPATFRTGYESHIFNSSLMGYYGGHLPVRFRLNFFSGYILSTPNAMIWPWFNGVYDPVPPDFSCRSKGTAQGHLPCIGWIFTVQLRILNN